MDRPTVVEEFQRGASVVLEDGTPTLFSAEFAGLGPGEEGPTADDARAAIAERVRPPRGGRLSSVAASRPADMGRRPEPSPD